MSTHNTVSSAGLSVQSANVLDARAAAGSLQARQRQAALMAVANEKGLPAKSATSAAIMLQNTQDAKVQLRTDIALLRDVIADDMWPTEVVVTDANGSEVTVTLASKEEAENLLEDLETRLQSMSDMTQTQQLQLQAAMNNQQQAMQVVSNVMKSYHDTAKAIIQNMR